MSESQLQPRPTAPEPVARENAENWPTMGVIHTIGDGLPSSNTSSNQLEEFPSKRPRTEDIIAFADDDLQNVQVPHTYPVVISLIIANHDVKRILVDNGSSADILYYDAFIKMLLSITQL